MFNADIDAPNGSAIPSQEVVEKLRHFLGPTGVNKLKLPEVIGMQTVQAWGGNSRDKLLTLQGVCERHGNHIAAMLS